MDFLQKCLCAVIVLWPIVAAQAEHPVRLKHVAEVAADTVWLSDLLPPASSDELHRVCRRVALGRAPQPGSLRSFTSDAIARRAGANEHLAGLLEIPDRVVVRRTGQAAPVPASQRRSSSHSAPVAMTLVKSGQNVLLTLERGEMRIQIPGVCLDRGAMGDHVRMRDVATRRVFEAEVSGAGSLRARLP